MYRGLAGGAPPLPLDKGVSAGAGVEAGIVGPPYGSPTRPARLDLIGKSVFAYPVVVADDLFKALADSTRRTILDELAEKSGQTLFEICSRLSMKHRLGLSRQGISQHLAVLEAAGLVETRREGRYKFHDLNTTPLRGITERWPVHDASGPEESTP